MNFEKKNNLIILLMDNLTYQIETELYFRANKFVVDASLQNDYMLIESLNNHHIVMHKISHSYFVMGPPSQPNDWSLQIIEKGLWDFEPAFIYERYNVSLEQALSIDPKDDENIWLGTKWTQKIHRDSLVREILKIIKNVRNVNTKSLVFVISD